MYFPLDLLQTGSNVEWIRAGASRGSGTMNGPVEFAFQFVGHQILIISHGAVFTFFGVSVI